MTYLTTIPVRVWRSRDTSEDGDILFQDNDIIIKLHSGVIISGKTTHEDIVYEIRNNVALGETGSKYQTSSLLSKKIRFKPFVIIRHPYTNEESQLIEDIFPPSTDGFYGRLQAGKNDALYTIQPLVDNDHFWLVISDLESNQIYEAHIIRHYEAEALSMVEDSQIRHALFLEAAKNRAKSRKEITSILNKPAPSWTELVKLVEDVSVPDLKIGKTLRATLSQLVPSSFPQSIREELMTFLAYVLEGKIPDEDPLVYLYRFSSMNILEQLIIGHLMHLIYQTKWPSYVKLMIQAERGELSLPKKAITKTIKDEPWILFSQKCAEHIPNWLNIVIDSAKRLNESRKVILRLPTTKSSAQKSRKAWKLRFSEITYGIRLFGHINEALLGLVELIYLGAAYRWPHRHMKFITRLGGYGDSTPHLQVMLVPNSAAERIKRALPSVLSVAWSTRSVNLGLYDTKSRAWKIPTEKILGSVEKRSNLKRLQELYGGSSSLKIHQASREEVKTMDLVAGGVHLAYLEVPEFLANWGYDTRKGRQIIKNLVNQDIIRLTYDVANRNLVPLAIIAQGNSNKIISIISAFLQNTPTSYARLDETRENMVILTRLPEDSVYDITSQLTSRGVEQGINIRCMRPTTYRSYTSNLYQRLFQDDGIWDDDVSAFLSQARSKRKELSESNA